MGNIATPSSVDSSAAIFTPAGSRSPRIVCLSSSAARWQHWYRFEGAARNTHNTHTSHAAEGVCCISSRALTLPLGCSTFLFRYFMFFSPLPHLLHFYISFTLSLLPLQSVFSLSITLSFLYIYDSLIPRSISPSSPVFRFHTSCISIALPFLPL